MAKDKLHAHIVLDRSGSMMTHVTSTIDAVNEYVHALATDDDVDARISLTLFDSDVVGRPAIELVVDNANVKDWKKLDTTTYRPRGQTPLNDAIGHVIAATDGQSLRTGERVAIVIMTDGFENSSREHTKDSIKKLLDDRQAKQNWLVLYLGANQDSFAEGASRGLFASTTMNYAAESVIPAMRGAAASTMRYMKSGNLADATLSAEERKAALL